jgi:predicted aldo/keto reductase-like oxidoreductase
MKTGSVLAAGGLISIPSVARTQEEDEVKIKSHRILGRTGFKVSDISMGTTRMGESNLVRYAYDKGVNYFDTAEGYGNGDSEKKIGQAMEFMEREKIFITTKVSISEDESKESILNRFEECRKRLNTEYVDCLYMHSVKKLKLLNHTGFHQAVKELKSDGRLKYMGLSSHGPRADGDSMEKVMVAAAEDGRFDVMLFVYNFIKKDAGDKILEACKKNNVGTTAMKISPGEINVAPFDPKNPTTEQKKSLDRMIKRGRTPAQAEERLANMINRDTDELKEYKPFFEKYGVKTKEQLEKSTIQWILGDERMHTICVSLREFDMIDRIVPISGTRLSSVDGEMLEKYGKMLHNKYCRHSCNLCQNSCPHNMPVSTIMRYSNYAINQGREKYAMSKYAALGDKNGNICLTCDGHCANACPFGVNIQSNLVKSHAALTLA